jgi:hypothetical protein
MVISAYGRFVAKSLSHGAGLKSWATRGTLRGGCDNGLAMPKALAIVLGIAAGALGGALIVFVIAFP